MVQRIFLSALVLSLAACGDSEVRVSDGLGPSSDTSKSGTYVQIQGLSAANVDRLVITVSPESTTTSLAYDKNRGTFAGYLVLAAGDHVLNASAYQSRGDAGPGTVVGTGSAPVTVPAGGSAAVSMTIYDTTTATTVNGDIAPIISRFTASKVAVKINESLTVNAQAIDFDGDVISYAWSDDCGGTFANPAAASTTWKKASSGACLLTIKVTAKGLSQSSAVSVAVASLGDGTATVSGMFIGRPTITSLSVYGQHGNGDNFSEHFYRDANWRGLNVWDVKGGTSVSLSMNVDNLYNLTASVSDNCGGTGTSTGNVYANWLPPVADGGVIACKVTASVSNGTFSDQFSIGIEVR